MWETGLVKTINEQADLVLTVAAESYFEKGLSDCTREEIFFLAQCAVRASLVKAENQEKFGEY